MKKVVLTAVLMILAAGLVPAQQDIAYLWAGGHFDESYNWNDTIMIAADEWLDVPIYFSGGPNIWSSMLFYPFGARYDIIDSFDISGCSSDYWPFNSGEHGWSQRYFGDYNDDTNPVHPNPPGYHSLSFIGFAHSVWFDSDYLHSEIPVHILDFRVHVTENLPWNDTLLSDIFIEGQDYISGGPIEVTDSMQWIDYPVVSSYAWVRIQPQTNGYAYLPGDANMVFGEWPPYCRGADVTFLVNYFRGSPINQPCNLDGFFASADVNGDCRVVGSDVTRMVNFYRGLVDKTWCPDYPPLWETEQALPSQAPPGWPNCE